MALSETHPISHWDSEHKSFILPSHNFSNSDSVAVTLDCLFRITDSSQASDLRYRCFFFAFDWQREQVGAPLRIPQCTILNYRHYESALNHITAQMELAANTASVMSNVLLHGVPRCSTAIFRFLGSKRSVAVSFAVKQRTDDNITSAKFWQVEFTCEMFADQDTPEAEVSDWDLSRVDGPWIQPAEVAE
jgi:hypothetical protein